ncbi:MAG: PBSX family phage terminase large subunit [Sphaerochaetaceae bacterium]|nr:PBSX family phage terminase large subunit [Sphaerochaetaceae bacterium]
MLSHKQIESYQQSDARINIWVGAVRSGKTYSSLRKLLNLIRTGPPGDCMIIGVSRDSIQRNVLNELYKFLGEDPPTPKRTQEKLYGRNIYFVGATDVSAVRRIQGATLAIAYVDEIACVPEVFIKMLQSRLSVTGAQLLATCNPEGPAHWLKKQYIDKQDNLNLKVFNFTLEDNPSLSEEYKNDLKKEYTGAWYKRLILGEWAVAQGLVYDAVDDDNFFEEDNFNNPNFYIAGIDYGINNPTVCLLAACNPRAYPQIRIIDEYYFNQKDHPRPKTDAELADDLEKFLENKNVKSVYIDPSAASLKLELDRRNLPVYDAVNDVIPGIQVVNKFLLGKNLLISNKCTNLKDELYTYSWDAKAADRGEDKPVKVSDHCCDSLRYLIFTEFPEGDFEAYSKDSTYKNIVSQILPETNSLLDFSTMDYY